MRCAVDYFGAARLSEEKIGFTRRFIVLGNLALVAWVFLAFFSVLFYTIIYSWLYLILEAVVIYVILRRLGCSSCYKCKACTSGFGRLAGAFFGRGFVKKESVGNRIGLSGFRLFSVASASSGYFGFVDVASLHFSEGFGSPLPVGRRHLQLGDLEYAFDSSRLKGIWE